MIWEGLYDKFSDVPVRGNGFANDELVKDTVLYTKKVIENQGHVEIAIKDHMFLSFLTSSCFFGKDNVKIIYFGGGAGIGYVIVRKFSHSKVKINYFVIEIDALVEPGINFWKDNTFLEKDSICFMSELPPVNIKPDIVYTSGIFQYIDDYKNKIKELCSYHAPFLFFAKFSAVNSNTYVTSQNSYGSVIPYRFINRKELINIVKDYGYELVFSKMSEVVYDQRNFEESMRMNSPSNFLFVPSDT